MLVNAIRRIWRWAAGLVALVAGAVAFLLPMVSNTGQANLEASNIERLRAEIAPELERIRAETILPIYFDSGLTLTDIQLFPGQIKLVHSLAMPEPLAWVNDTIDQMDPAAFCDPDAFRLIHLAISHGTTYMADYHGITADGRKVFRQVVAEPYGCRGMPGFEFLTAR